MDAAAEPPATPAFAVGDPVRLGVVPAFLRTADPMPMLRPPDLVDPAEVGRITEVRAMGRLAVRFRRGTFLLDGADLSPAPADS